MVLSAAMRAAVDEDPLKTEKRCEFVSQQRASVFEGPLSDGSLLLKKPCGISVFCQRDGRQMTCCFRKKRRRSRSEALWVAFDFYSKLQPPAQQLAQRGATYDEMKACNERLSFFELLQFCRDFEIVPSLVCKQALDVVWRLCAADHDHSSDKCHFRHTDHSRGHVRDCGMLFPEFLRLLVRLALVAFPQEEDPRLAARRLADFLKSSDARHLVRTKGRETQRRLYARSKGEVNRRASEVLVDEKKQSLLRRKKERRRRQHSDDDVKEEEDDEKPRLKRAVDLYSMARANTMTVAEQRSLDRYDPTFVDEFQAATSSEKDWVPFDTLGLDFGTLTRGNGPYFARVDVLNQSKTTLLVLKSVSCDGLSFKASFDPRPFAPGLLRHIDLVIHPNQDEYSGSLSFELFSSSPQEKGRNFSYSLPLYYKSVKQ